jgi:hypothetical protein
VSHHFPKILSGTTGLTPPPIHPPVQVDALSTKLKADPKDEQDDDDENMGDVDLWSISGGEGMLC